MRGYCTFVMLMLMSVPAVAAAGTLYRCDGADGRRRYSNHTPARGENCTQWGSCANTPAPPLPPERADKKPYGQEVGEEGRRTGSTWGAQSHYKKTNRVN